MSAHILVVEDEAIIARDIRTTLQMLGYDVAPTVASGAAALRSIAERTPDLILMDVNIQGDMDGIETARRIRETHAMPIVYLTSYSDEATLQRAKNTGASGYVLKPFSDRDLRTAIEVALQKHEIEQRHAERERWFATTLRSIGDAVIATDASQRITFMNAVAEQVTGWTMAEATGRMLGEVFRLIDTKTGTPIDSPLTRVFQEGFSVELPRDVALSMKSGTTRAVDDSAAPIVDDRGKMVGGVVVFRDVTERRMLDERLAQNERLAAIGALSAGMAHEINNPLAYVLTNVSFAVEAFPAMKDRVRALGGPDAQSLIERFDELGRALEEAQEGSRRVHRIVHDLKKLGRTDISETSTLELGDVIESAIRMVGNVVRQHARIRLELGITPFVEANEGQLGQVFINLLVNAAQAIAEGHSTSNEIVVATFTDETGRAVAEVRDTGPGMSPETKRRIFEPFFTTKGIGQGSGLGLSIAHSIVGALGGELTVDSVLGKGTTFRVSLRPVLERERAAPEPRAVTAARTRARVLIIDDEPAIGRAMTRVLQSEHDVFVVTDAREALPTIAAGEAFDIIFCDLMMPTMTGLEFFEAVKATKPEVAAKIVFVTGGAFTAREQAFLEGTTNPTLTKPVEPRALRKIVADAVGRKPDAR